jgi:Lactonase, 7-bladed beta-propeller
MVTNRIRSINRSVLRWVCALTVVLVPLASVGHAQFFIVGLEQLYVGNVGTASSPTPSIQVYNTNGGLSLSGSLLTSGPPMALAQGPTYIVTSRFFRQFVYGTLYAAISAGSVEQYGIDARTGNTWLAASYPVGSIPSAIIATPTNLYVGNRGSNSISVFTIDPGSGNLTPLQTLTGVTSPAELAIDPNQQILVSSGGTNFCTMRIEKGELSTPMCTPPLKSPPPPAKILFVDSVLYMTVNSNMVPVNQLQAWRVDRNTGAFTQAATPISLGSWVLYGLAKVPGVNAVYLSRTGGVTQVNPVSSGFTMAAHFNVTGVPASMFADPRGGRLFVTDTAQNSVLSLTVGSNGALMSSATAAGTPGQQFPKGMSLFFQ